MDWRTYWLTDWRTDGLTPPDWPQSPLTTFRSDSNSQSGYIRQRCAKMSTLRNAWFENPEKKVFWEKSHFMKKPVIFYFNFRYLRKKYVTKVWNVSSYCSNFFLFWWKEALVPQFLLPLQEIIDLVAGVCSLAAPAYSQHFLQIVHYRISHWNQPNARNWHQLINQNHRKSH